MVAPPAGAWIEMRSKQCVGNGSPVAPPAGAWIEIALFGEFGEPAVSRLPQARGLKLPNADTTRATSRRASRRRVD